MTINLTPEEKQIIIDELTNAIIARKTKQRKYSLKLQQIKDKILAAH